MGQHWESHEKSRGVPREVPWTSIGSPMDVPRNHYEPMGGALESHGSARLYTLMGAPREFHWPRKAHARPLQGP